ncbi:MAG: hydantoinase/oxoprolinase family protein [Deltaproteobacteria bacterium]|nr:MAG: hydantoinase/oxoprolinase family protein [Deltaproteobacteria bacterium]
MGINEKSKKYLVGVDTGGTFTDCVVMDDQGDITIGKSPSTPSDFSKGILNSLEVVAKEMGITRKELLSNAQLFSHGTTVATNATITRQGMRIGFITTKGFEDTLYIQRGKGRVDGLLEMDIRHESTANKPVPLVPRKRIKGVSERVDCFGKVVVPLQEEELREMIRDLVENEKVESIGVCLLWSFAHKEHEQRIKQIIKEMYPSIYVAISCELVPGIHEYARSNTTAIDAFVGPLTRVYFDSLKERLADEGYKRSIMIMQSYGGVVDVDDVKPVFTAVSGPAGGVIAARYWADLLGIENVISTDVGGTSFDVSVIPHRERIFAKEPYVGRFRVLLPTIDIVTIGAGGGSTAWVDENTRTLKVGPQSAGAEPGPVCYGRGGTIPTVTDADVVLGYIDPDYFLGGKMKLDKEAAVTAIKNLGKEIGLDAVETAAGIYDIQNEHMVDLIRSAMIERGYDPRDFSVFAFGGGGPTHAATYGPENKAKSVVMFPMSSVFSAFGIVTSDVIHTTEISKRFRFPVDPKEVDSIFGELENTLLNKLNLAGFEKERIVLERTVKMRYGMQVHELRVPVKRKKYTDEDMQLLSDDFEKRYEQIYGKDTGYREGGIDIVSFEVEAVGLLNKPKIRKNALKGADSSHAVREKRDVFFRGAGGFVPTNIYDMTRLEAGNIIEGPAVIEVPTTTVVILPEQVARIDEYMNIVI